MTSLRCHMTRPILHGAAWMAAAAASLGHASQPEPVTGAKIFNFCAACHEPGKENRTGPELRGVVGRPSATVPGFRYSRAMQRAGLKWDEATLDTFLADPQALVPGNAMPFPGIADASQRHDLINYLKNLK